MPLTISILDFNFNTPNTVNLNESFSVKIEMSTLENYDVKVFVKNNERKITSEIFDDTWKNPYFYLKSKFPTKSEFKIRVILDEGNQEICARLRKTGKTSFKEKCNNLTILQIKHNEIKAETIKKESSKNITKIFFSKEMEKDNSKDTPIIQTNLSSIRNSKEKNKKIILNKVKNKEAINIFITKQEKLFFILPYLFLGFCIIIIIFLSLRVL